MIGCAAIAPRILNLQIAMCGNEGEEKARWMLSGCSLVLDTNEVLGGSTLCIEARRRLGRRKAGGGDHPREVDGQRVH